MKVEITDKHGVLVDGKLYTKGQAVDKEENEGTKKAWVESGIAVKVDEIKVKKENV